MEYRRYRDTEQKVSLLGLGCMRFPRTGVGEEIDYARAEEIIDYAYASGVNYFDTAYLYNAGDSERVTGRALDKYPRESYMLATKLPIMKVGSRQEILDTFREQQDRCQKDYFDFYLIHDVKESSIDGFQRSFVLETVLELKEAGKIRRLGFSSHGKPETLERFAKMYAWDFAQIQLNYFDWEYQNAKRQYEILRELDLPIIVMEPVRGGRLAALGTEIEKKLHACRPDKSTASWAMRYVAQLPGVLTVLSGMNDLEQVRDNVATMSNPEPLSAGEMKAVEAAAAQLRDQLLLPCTGCRYCIDCPAGLDIPLLLNTYNNYALSRWHFDLLPAYHLPADRKPDQCAGCGQCRERCPQGIDIPAALGELARYLAESDSLLQNV
jgi:predicted aldo/keto reductase-like oxidoreductase